MKFSAVLLLATLLALASVSSAYKPAAICFQKAQRCCFRFRACGYVVRKDRVKSRCDYKHCRKVCKPYCYRHCERKHVRVAKQVCKPKYVRICRRAEVERAGKWIWIKKCDWVPRGRRCHTKFHYVWRHVCYKKCYPKCYRRCYLVHAICVRYRIFHYPKFCPKLSCDPVIFHGPHKVPAHVVSPKGKLIKVTHPKRTIIGKRRH